MAEVFLAGESQLVIPLLAETAHERFAEELVEAYATGAAALFGWAANVPAVVVEGGEGSYWALAQWI